MEDLRVRLNAPRALLDVVWTRNSTGGAPGRLWLLDPWELGRDLFYTKLRRDRRVALEALAPPELVVPSVAGTGLEEFVQEAPRRAPEGVIGVVFKHQLSAVACLTGAPCRNDMWIAWDSVY